MWQLQLHSDPSPRSEIALRQLFPDNGHAASDISRRLYQGVPLFPLYNCGPGLEEHVPFAFAALPEDMNQQTGHF